MGDLKRKIVSEKIENKISRMVTFSKRRLGLYKKASKLCLLSGAKIAILTTPVSSESNVSFFSFGHSSVDSVVSAFLADQRPTDDNTAARKELGFWWEDERLAKSENSKELSDAIDSISSLLQSLKGLHSEVVENRREHKDDLKKKDVVLHETHQELDQNQALNFQSSSASICIQDDSPASFEGFIKNSEEEDQIVANYDNNMNKDVVLHETHQENDQNQTLNLQSSSASIEIQDDLLVRFNKNSEEEDQIVAVSDNNNNNNNTLAGNLDGCNQELDQYIDFLMNCEDLSMNLDMCLSYEAIEDGGGMV